MIPTAMRMSPIVHKMPTPKTRPRIKQMTPSTITSGQVPLSGGYETGALVLGP
jgi:hypothetical protein